MGDGERNLNGFRRFDNYQLVKMVAGGEETSRLIRRDVGMLLIQS